MLYTQPQTDRIRLSAGSLTADIAGAFCATANGIRTTEDRTYAPTGSGIAMRVGKSGYAAKGIASNADTIRLSPANSTNTVWDSPSSQASVLVVVRRTGTATGNAPIFGNNSPGTAPYSPWGFTDEAGAGKMQFGIATGSGLVEIVEPSAGMADALVHVYIGTYDGTTVRLYRDGVLTTSGAQSGSLNYFSAADRGTAIGNFFNYAGTRTFIGEVYAGALCKRAYSAAEVKTLSANPWQIFLDEAEEDEPALFAADAAGPADLVGAPSTQANTSGSGGVTQTHLLAGAPTVQSNASGAGAVAQTHVLGASACTQVNESPGWPVSQSHQLVGAGSVQENVSGTGEETQEHLLAGAPCSQANASGAGAVGQTHVLGGAACVQVNESGTGEIALTGQLVGAPCAQANVSPGLNITQTHVLGGSACVQSNLSPGGAIVVIDDSVTPDPENILLLVAEDRILTIQAEDRILVINT